MARQRHPGLRAESAVQLSGFLDDARGNRTAASNGQAAADALDTTNLAQASGKLDGAS